MLHVAAGRGGRGGRPTVTSLLRQWGRARRALAGSAQAHRGRAKGRSAFSKNPEISSSFPPLDARFHPSQGIALISFLASLSRGLATPLPFSLLLRPPRGRRPAASGSKGPGRRGREPHSDGGLRASERGQRTSEAAVQGPAAPHSPRHVRPLCHLCDKHFSCLALAPVCGQPWARLSFPLTPPAAAERESRAGRFL